MRKSGGLKRILIRFIVHCLSSIVGLSFKALSFFMKHLIFSALMIPKSLTTLLFVWILPQTEDILPWWPHLQLWKLKD